MSTATCQTVVVTVTEPDGTEVGRLTMPAFTRDPTDLRDLVDAHFETYLDRSRRARQPVSLADFALFLTMLASREPTTIEVPS